MKNNEETKNEVKDVLTAVKMTKETVMKIAVACKICGKPAKGLIDESYINGHNGIWIEYRCEEHLSIGN